MSSTGFKIGELSRRVLAKTPVADLTSELGPAVLVGSIPGDGLNGWLARTAAVEVFIPAPKPDGSNLAATTDCWPLRKREGSKAFLNVVLIGRASSNDVVIPHASISKLHARLQFEAGGTSVSNASSRNGVLVNQTLLRGEQKAPLRDGDTVTFGLVHLTFMETSKLLQILATRPLYQTPTGH